MQSVASPSPSPSPSGRRLPQPPPPGIDWIPPPFRHALQGTRDSLENLGLRLQELLSRVRRGGDHGPEHRLHPDLPNHEVAAPLHTYSFEETARRQLEAWTTRPSWTEKPADLKVLVPKGTLCQLDTIFQVGLPPDALFDIITDPENKRVFKSIKEVTYRKVHEDEGHRQLVEVEQAAIWRFLCFSGTISIRVFVDQNRKDHSVSFYLAKDGFMKKFEGTWNVKPIYVDAPHCAFLPSPADDPACMSSRVASEVTLKQTVQPKLIPPPPISWYIRGITSRQVETLLADLQAEAGRLREGRLGQDQCQQNANSEGFRPDSLDGQENRTRSRRGRKNSWRM